MKQCFFGSIFYVLFPVFLHAQSYDFFGARASGMGHATVTVSDEWAPFYNIAGIASQEKYVAGLCYKNDFGLRDFRKAALTLVGPLWKGGIGLSFFRSGNNYYNTNRISLGYAHKISLIRLGLQIHYAQTAMEDLGVSRNILFDFGGIAELIPSRLFFGANVFNINQARSHEALLPVVMKAGLSYRPGKKIMVNGEVEKDILYASTVKAGLEYAVVENGALRTGFTTHPFASFFGAGLRNNLLKLDYSVSIHTQLGNSHRISLSIFLHRIKLK